MLGPPMYVEGMLIDTVVRLNIYPHAREDGSLGLHFSLPHCTCWEKLGCGGGHHGEGVYLHTHRYAGPVSSVANL